MASSGVSTFSRTCLVHFDCESPNEPYISFELPPGGLSRLVVRIWFTDMRDQQMRAFQSDPARNTDCTATGFSFGLVDETKETNEWSDISLFEFQRNSSDFEFDVLKCETNTWVIGLAMEDFDDHSETQGWLESLAQAEGLTIGVFPLANGKGSHITVWRIDVDVHSNVRTTVSHPSDRNARPIEGVENPAWPPQKNRGHWKSTRSLQNEDIISLGREAIDAASKHGHRNAEKLERLGSKLNSFFKNGLSSAGMDLVVRLWELIVEATPNGHPLQPIRSIYLAMCISSRHDFSLQHPPPHFDTEKSLTRAIDILGCAIYAPSGLLPDNDKLHPGSLMCDLSCLLTQRYIITHQSQDLDQAINLMHNSIANTPTSHSDHGKRLILLCRFLFMKSKLYGKDFKAIIHEAIEVAKTAAPLLSHMDQRYSLVKVLNDLRNHHIPSISDTDIESVIQLLQEQVKMEAYGHEQGHFILLRTVLSVFHFEKHDRTGNLKNLHASIELLEQASRESSNSTVDVRVNVLMYLGHHLCQRCALTGATPDLEDSIETLQTAVSILPKDYIWYKRHGVFMVYASALYARFRRKKDINDLNLAIELLDDFANNIPPAGEELVPTVVALVANLRHKRYERIACEEDAEQAIELVERTIKDFYPTAANHDVVFGNLKYILGELLAARYDQNKVEIDLDRAIEALLEARDCLEDIGRAQCLQSLGEQLGKRMDLQPTKVTQEDYDFRLQCFVESWECTATQPSFRISSAYSAAFFLSQARRWEEANDILSKAVELLPSVSPRHLHSADQQHMLKKCAGIGRFAAAVALKAGRSPEYALRLLELGQAIMASLLLETRAEVTSLKGQHPDLAERFEYLRDMLDCPPDEIIPSNPSDSLSRRTTETKRKVGLDEKFQEVVAEIRSQPGFEDFLLPPSESAVKQAATNSGPIVVINISVIQCDAFIITRTGIQQLPLPNLKVSDIQAAYGVRISPQALEKLWENAAKPILEQLGFQGIPKGTDKWPRVWWVLTGSLNRLPFHAAGHHHQGSTDTVLDRVVSSYSTSIKSLLYAQRNSEKSRQSSNKNAVLVSMATTPSNSDHKPSRLHFAEQETKALEKILTKEMSTEILSNPSKKDVMSRLGPCTIFHFAGHGVSDPTDPLQSRLLLKDWAEDPMTVDNLMLLKLSQDSKSPFMAYLSACSTGESRVERLNDESLHLMSACQLAGFSHAVGSLWKVDDKYSYEAALEVYKTVQDGNWSDESVALGVHNAVKLLRMRTREGQSVSRSGIPVGLDVSDVGELVTTNESGENGKSGRGLEECATREEGDPSVWAAYIHYGP